MIKFEQVSFNYQNEQTRVLENISFHIKPGECIGLIGKSGCGKSTLLKIINGIIPNMIEGKLTGKITIDNINPCEVSIQNLSKSVGSIFQNPKSQFFQLNTTDEITFGCTNHNIKKNEILKRLALTTKIFNIEHLIDKNIFHLSGGEKQRIACASIFTQQPKIILMDEPSSNLDIEGIDALRQVIVNIKAQGHTLLIAEHRLYYLMSLCDYFIYMDKGKIVNMYQPAALRQLLPKKRKEMGLRTVKIPSIDKKKFSNEQSSTLILDKLTVKYKKDNILNIKKYQFKSGNVVAMVGNNGAGKSTLAKALCGLIPIKGQILNDKVLSRRQRNKNFFMVMQDVNHQLFSESVYDELLLGHPINEKNEKKALNVLEMMDLTALKDHHPLALSGGQKQRVAIASAIFSECDYLIFDEPTSGLDYCHMLKFADTIKMIKHCVKLILIITHDYELIEVCCDDIVCIKKGQIQKMI